MNARESGDYGLCDLPAKDASLDTSLALKLRQGNARSAPEKRGTWLALEIPSVCWHPMSQTTARPCH